MKANAFVAFILRSPLYPVLGNTMLITVTGRRTGRRISTPVNYARCGSELWILSSQNRNWWRNIGEATPVCLRLGGRDVRAVADLVLDPATIADRILEYARIFPAATASLGLGAPASALATAARLSRERLFVRIRPELPSPSGSLPNH